MNLSDDAVFNLKKVVAFFAAHVSLFPLPLISSFLFFKLILCSLKHNRHVMKFIAYIDQPNKGETHAASGKALILKGTEMPNGEIPFGRRR